MNSPNFFRYLRWLAVGLTAIYLLAIVAGWSVAMTLGDDWSQGPTFLQFVGGVATLIVYFGVAPTIVVDFVVGIWGLFYPDTTRIGSRLLVAGVIVAGAFLATIIKFPGT